MSSQDVPGRCSPLAWFAGKGSGKSYLVTFLGLLGTFLALLTASIMQYSNFSLVEVQVSELGSAARNSGGCVYFQVAFCILGLLVIPPTLFAVNSVTGNTRLGRNMGKFWLSAAGVGLFLVGLFDMGTSSIVHYVGAAMAMFGILIGALQQLPAVTRTLKPAKKSVKIAAGVLYLQILVANVLTISFCAVPVLLGIKSFDDPPDFWSAYEWSLLITGITWLTGFILVASIRNLPRIPRNP